MQCCMTSNPIYSQVNKKKKTKRQKSQLVKGQCFSVIIHYNRSKMLNPINRVIANSLNFYSNVHTVETDIFLRMYNRAGSFNVNKHCKGYK